MPYAAGPVGPLLGTLTVANGATLVMANQAPNPPAGANVNTFNLNTGGTLWMQFAASPTAPTPYINANTANLAGRLVVDLATTNGLYQNTYNYQDIIDANTRNGTFSSVVMARPSARTPSSTITDRMDDFTMDSIIAATYSPQSSNRSWKYSSARVFASRIASFRGFFS